MLAFCQPSSPLMPTLLRISRSIDRLNRWIGRAMGDCIALFYLCGVAPPEVKTTDIYRGFAPFIIIQLIGLGLLILFPGMVTGLLG